jgi:hypothetical protein
MGFKPGEHIFGPPAAEDEESELPEHEQDARRPRDTGGQPENP